MSDNNIHVGDDVSWNWGGEHPTGKVVEMKTSGKLEIESKGKRVFKNADAGNPAVHVGRDGNDVVKRASELTRLRGGGEGDDVAAKASSIAEDVHEGRRIEKDGKVEGVASAAREGGVVAEEVQPTAEEPKKKATRGKRGGIQATAEVRKKQSEGGKKGAAAKKAAGGRKGRKVAAEEAEVGQKRERGEVEKTGEDIDMQKGEKEKVPVTTEQEMAEKMVGKEAKKVKVAQEGSVGEQVAKTSSPPPTVAEVTAASQELEELKRDQTILGPDVGKGASVTTTVETGSTGSGEVTEATRVGLGSSRSEKKKAGRKSGAKVQ